MGDETAGQQYGSELSTHLGDRWGDDITSERKAELEAKLQQWEAEVDQLEKQGPFARFHSTTALTGADVFWLAARSLAGSAGQAAIAGAQYNLRRAQDDSALRHLLKLPELHLEMADLTEAHLANAALAEAHLEGAIVSGADLKGANLANTHLKGATLIGTQLEEAWLSEIDCSYSILRSCNLRKAFVFHSNFVHANLDGALLSGSTLYGVQLSNASLRSVNFDDASLQYADLSEADLFGGRFLGCDLSHANLTGAYLCEARFDVNTNLSDVKFDVRTCLADIRWGGAPLTRVNWSFILQLGDETHTRRSDEQSRYQAGWTSVVTDSATAARAYSQLAVALRSQGLNDYADNYVYRAQLMQREVLRWHKKWGAYLFSLLLFLISGYGYRLWRIVATYAAVVLGFSCIYWALGVHSFTHESGIQTLWDSFLVSLTAIHGRTTFEQLGAWSPAAWTAAVESVFGIVIEGIFVAMLIQRFFAR